jgi:hypothetical protein
VHYNVVHEDRVYSWRLSGRFAKPSAKSGGVMAAYALIGAGAIRALSENMPGLYVRSNQNGGVMPV